MARKTYTSTDVKRKYNERVYSQINVQIPEELAKRFREKCDKANIPQRQILIDAITRFVDE